MKHSAENEAFTNTVVRLMAIPKAEILCREAEDQKQADLNPHKRGPKRKVKYQRFRSCA